MILNLQKKYKFLDKNHLENSLIVVGSLLLGIWATDGTIAIRNILLVLGSIISITYCLKYLKKYNLRVTKTSFIYWVPLLLIVLMFCWVIFHYIYFTKYPEKQFHELISTWFRAFLATIIGFAIGLVLSSNPERLWTLSVGLIISFLILFYQYIPLAFENQSLFITELKKSNYIYSTKFNGVIAGILLIGNILGMLMDKLLAQRKIIGLNKNNRINKIDISSFNIIIIIYSILGIFLPIYSFVFIFDAKNGIGVTGILIFLFGVIIFFLSLFNVSTKKKLLYNNVAIWKILIIYIAFLGIFAVLLSKHTKNNPGWEYLFEDILISSDITNNKNWHNPIINGYPQRKNGELVKANTYERVSWAIVGLEILRNDPIGLGIFRALPLQIKTHYKSDFQNNDFVAAVYTHSGWVDLGLAFGLPGIMLIPLALMISIYLALKKICILTGTVIFISCAILILYMVGEYSFQHGIEILFFFTAFVGVIVANKNMPKH